MIADARPNGGGFFVLYRPDRPASRECRGYDFEFIWRRNGYDDPDRHRESHDIDIFLDDPQLLGHRPSGSHLHFETMPSDYLGDGLRFQKFAFEDVGEIDFIVAGALTTKPLETRVVEGRTVRLETIPEIIAKKVYYRGFRKPTRATSSTSPPQPGRNWTRSSTLCVRSQNGSLEPDSGWKNSTLNSSAAPLHS
ncbi:hypothetical protein [Mesorhizobium sp.]|uniref:hypothetical protein n=1 Tax=Mesorhizobium sp. TaxID=1871066 RepID=UPI000FE981FE|nr:hypothetical protein [Mesorhizobium sp.]RWP68830.1 MAG: hypothetical protein EOR09_30565 [Mesorhizobium sp.]